MRAEAPTERGFSLVEVLVAVTLGALLVTSLADVVRNSLEARTRVEGDNALAEDARFALERILRAVRGSGLLLIPTPDRPATPGTDESVREPGVLALTLDPATDRDRDGFADADDDRDGRIDEDPGKDASADGAAGLIGIDDDADGEIDEGAFEDDDEDGLGDEDWYGGGDDDGDGLTSEDLRSDVNGDGAPGVAGADDDGDGLIDEGNSIDDDEDGLQNEDHVDAVVFYLSGTDLIERIPVPWDEDQSGENDGTDFVERTVASGVSRFRTARLEAPVGGPPLVEVTLELTDARGETIALGATARMGGGW